MAAMITSAASHIAQAAHHAVVAALAHSPAKIGDSIPNVALKLTPESADLNISTTPGKVIILGVPGAFTPSCSSQIPNYIKNYEKVRRNGYGAIYVVSVNDAFVMNAWKEKLAPEGTPIHFVADDQAHFASALGLVMDATSILGGPRSKRYVIVADNGKIQRVQVEEDPAQVTVSSCDATMKELDL